MRKNFQAALMLSAFAIGCHANHPPPATRPATQPTTRPADRLVGTWIADHPDPKSGDLQVKLTFTKRPHEKLLAWSELPLRGLARTNEAPFTATDDAITSSAFRGAQSLAYRFDDKGQLLVRRSDGTTLTFHRVK